MSGESIYRLAAKAGAQGQGSVPSNEGPYTGKYKKNLGEPTKPVYSTFYEKGKEYDGSHVRYFKQRDAIIGKNVADTVDPKDFLKRGAGVRHIVPAVHEEKIYCKPPVDHGARAFPDASDPSGLDAPGYGGPHNPGGMPGDASGGDRGAPAGSGPQSNSPDDGLSAAYGSGNRYSGVGTGANNGGNGRATKDFVASNIVEADNMVPKRRKDQPKYATGRKDFGKVPAYLERVKGEVQGERDFVQSLEQARYEKREELYQNYVFRLSREEHDRLIKELEARLSQLGTELNKMPFAKDTSTMSKRKTEIERTMGDIESALKKLRKDVLFIYKDDPVNGQWTKEAALKEAQRFAAAQGGM